MLIIIIIIIIIMYRHVGGGEWVGEQTDVYVCLCMLGKEGRRLRGVERERGGGGGGGRDLLFTGLCAQYPYWISKILRLFG